MPTATQELQTPARRASGALGRIPALDGIRALSILLVVATHTFPVGPKAWGLNNTTGLLGMSLFFCMSGFLITTLLYKRPDPYPFVVKRVLRIVPAAALYLTILLVFFDLPWRSWWLNMAFVSNYVHEGLDTGPVSHFWSLCVEMHFYLAITVAVWLLGRRALWLIPVAALVITGLRIEAGAHVNIMTHLRVDEILSGGCLALVALHYGDWLRARLRGAWVSVPALCVVGVLWFLSSHLKLGSDLMYFRPYFAAALVGVILHCDLKWLLRLLDNRVARYIADISYALYIYHPLMVFGWMNAGTTFERYAFKRPVSWALSVLAAHLSTRYWEHYWQALARRIVAPKP